MYDDYKQPDIIENEQLFNTDHKMMMEESNERIIFLYQNKIEQMLTAPQCIQIETFKKFLNIISSNAVDFRKCQDVLGIVLNQLFIFATKYGVDELSVEQIHIIYSILNILIQNLSYVLTSLISVDLIHCFLMKFIEREELLPPIELVIRLFKQYGIKQAIAIDYLYNALFEVASICISSFVSFIDFCAYIYIEYNEKSLPINDVYHICNDFLTSNMLKTTDYYILLRSVSNFIDTVNEFIPSIEAGFINILEGIIQTNQSNDVIFLSLNIILSYLQYYDEHNKDNVISYFQSFDYDIYKDIFFVNVISDCHMLIISKFIVLHIDYAKTVPSLTQQEFINFALNILMDSTKLLMTRCYSIKLLYYLCTKGIFSPDLFHFDISIIMTIIDFISTDYRNNEGYPILLISFLIKNEKIENINNIVDNIHETLANIEEEFEKEIMDQIEELNTLILDIQDIY